MAAGDGNADRYRLIQTSWALFEQDRYEELDMEALEHVSQESPAGRPAWVGWLATAYHALGDLDNAEACFAEIAADDFATMANDANWHSMSDFAEATALLGTREQARALRQRIARFERLSPVMGRGIACVGPFAYFLGRLAVREGNHAEAERLFAWSHDAAGRMGAKPRAELAQRRLDEVRATAGR